MSEAITDDVAERAGEDDERAMAMGDLPSIDDVKVYHTAKVMRDWIRTVLAPPALHRMYRIGMGKETFDTPTPAGNVVKIEAPPGVQVSALRIITALAIPTQMGLVDGNDNEFPGVVALPPLDLDAARQQAHGDRYVAPDVHARAVAQLQPGTPLPEGAAPAVAPLRPMHERIADGEFTVVEIEEGITPADGKREDTPPGAIASVETPEKAALRAHQERMAKRRRNGVASPVTLPEVKP